VSGLGITVHTVPEDHPSSPEGITRPRVIVSVTASADGRITLSRRDRLLDDGPNRRWKAVWPPDVGDLLARRAAVIGQRHQPTVVLEGSGAFAPDVAGSLDLPDAGLDELRGDVGRRVGCGPASEDLNLGSLRVSSDRRQVGAGSPWPGHESWCAGRAVCTAAVAVGTAVMPFFIHVQVDRGPP
jgi:hypothetical protein